MTKGRVVLLVIAAMVFLSVGFVIGQIVQAAGTIPGTAGDPLVAQSYVEKVVKKTVADMESKLDEMESKVADLEKQISDFSKDTGKTSTRQGSSSDTGSNTSSNTGKNSDNNSGGEDKKPASSAQGKTATVSGSSANVRSGPGTTYEKITTLVQGDKVTVILEENSWYKVTLSDGQEGWIANWLVEVKS
ncbi:MAG: SH3 domain-containing protein [Bacillota bacterium]|jgi:TolA-binding protein